VSNGMILAAESEEGSLSLLVPDREIKEGSRVH
jgi:tRNA-binding EMAP/Myf-like protein